MALQIVTSLFLFLKIERIFKYLYFSGHIVKYMLGCQNLSIQLTASDNYLGCVIRNILLEVRYVPQTHKLHGVRFVRVRCGYLLYCKKKRAEKKRKDGERDEKKIQCSAEEYNN